MRKLTWLAVAGWATLGSMSVLALFISFELLLFADASRAVIARLHIARGVAASLAAVAVSAYFVQQLLEQDQRRRDERFRFLDHLPVAAFVLTAEGKPHYANQAALKLLGRGVIPNAGRDSLSTVYPSVLAGTDEPYPPEQMPIVRALSGETSSVDNVELIRDGRRVPIEAIATPVHDEGGHISHSIAVFFDITDRRRGQEEHEKRIREEELRNLEHHLAEMQTQFLNHAAHQLLTPLTPLRLEVSALRSKDGSEGIERMHRNVERLGDLVQSLVKMAEVEAMTHRPTDESVALKVLAEQAAEVVRDGHDVGVVVHGPDAQLHCNKPLLQAGLEALIDNALRHCGDDTVWVSIEDGPTVFIKVHDNGGGWDGEMPKRWLEAFEQGEPDLAPGFGLGLFVARLAAEAHGGQLSGTSPGKGQGATFTFSIPRRT